MPLNVVTFRFIPLHRYRYVIYRYIPVSPMIQAVKPSISHIYAFVGLEGSTEELGLHGGEQRRWTPSHVP